LRFSNAAAFRALRAVLGLFAVSRLQGHAENLMQKAWFCITLAAMQLY
jgi:hypothetical protein